jgi:hypothetical protein
MPTIVKVRRRREPEPVWEGSNLYRRSPKFRRVMFLELLAWAIHQAEDTNSREHLREFEEELVRVREDVWSIRPWPEAAGDNDAFPEHVRELADVFANAHPEDVNYPGRNTNPSAA